MTCTDHNGHSPAYMQQWDGAKWVKVSDWIEPMKDKVSRCWTRRPTNTSRRTPAGRSAPRLATSRRKLNAAQRQIPLPVRGERVTVWRVTSCRSCRRIADRKRGARRRRENILSVNNIEVIYDHVILVLKGVSLDVPKGGIVALLGANGAGKTTTLKAISNLLHAERGDVTKGSILFEGDEVQDLSPNELVRRGCIQVMEGRQCFAHLTIEENLLTGAFTRRDGKAAIRARHRPGLFLFPQARRAAAIRSPATPPAASSRCARSAAR